MPQASQPRPYPPALRITLLVIALVLIAVTFEVMMALSHPSQYLNAYKTVAKGPETASALKKLSMFNPSDYLYLVGPITPASGSKKPASLFRERNAEMLEPATFMDSTGAVEVLSRGLPFLPKPAENYQFHRPLHLLGTRTSSTGFELFALAETRDELLTLLYNKTENWKISLFYQGLLLAFLVFTIFWLVNIIILFNTALKLVHLLIVNVVFLILYYSVLILSEYPMLETLFQTIGVLFLANLVFFILSWLLQKKKAV